MRVLVCIKQVPEIAELRFDAQTKTLIRAGVPNVVNPFDRRAVTEAVRLKQQHGAEVIVLTMGPPQAREALVECLAMGADRAVHLVDRAFAGADTLATAHALAAAARRIGFDLILCGKYSVDAETGQVGPELAELLDLPHVSGVCRLELAADLRYLHAERETDEGFEVVEAPLPVLLTAAERLNRPIKVDAEQVAAAAGRLVEVLTAADLAAGEPAGGPSRFGLAGSPTAVAEIRTLRVERHGPVVPAADPDAIPRLVAFLLDRGLFRPGEGHPPAARPPLLRRAHPERSIWAVAELNDGRLRPVSLELLGKGVDLADQVGGEAAAVLIGHGVAAHLKTLAAHGADRLYLSDHPSLAQYSPEGYAAVLAAAIGAYRPWAVLVPATAKGRDFAPRAAARLGLGLTGDCIGLEIDEQGHLIQLKPAFGGNVVAPILSRTFPQMATVRPGMLQPLGPDWLRTAAVVSLPSPAADRIRTRVLTASSDAGIAALALDEAAVVVGVGAGVAGPEGIPLLAELAGVLGGTIGATRRVVDNGWLPRQYQIGLTGRAVAPLLYLAIAVRGSFNHTVGVQRARTIVAINRDPQAEIFQSADFGLIGDYAEIVPQLVAALMAARAGQG